MEVTQCTEEPTLGATCYPTLYNLRRIVNGIGGTTEQDYVAIASGHGGGLLYVAISHAIFSVSTFQGLESAGKSFYDGAGMTLIAGRVGLCVCMCVHTFCACCAMERPGPADVCAPLCSPA